MYLWSVCSANMVKHQKKSGKSVVRKTVVVEKQRGRRSQKRTVKRVSRPRRSVAGLVAATDAGLRYLECAIAPRDFNGVMACIPDSFCGKSSVFRQKMLLPIGAPASTTGNWNASILIPAIPNVGAMIVTNHDTATFPNTATAVWSVYDYANAATVFPSPGTSPTYGTSMVQKFRYVSMTVELKQVGPMLTSGGSVSAARIPGFGLTEADAGTNVGEYLSGFGDVNQTNLQPLPGYYIAHVNAGAYGWSIHEDPATEFQELHLNSAYGSFGYADAGTPVAATGLASGYFMGFGNQQALALAITNATLATSFVLEVEAVIEYQPRGSSLMASLMADSPPEDKLALMSYQTAVRQMPAFVPVSENAGFWDKFLSVLSHYLPVAGSFLGPVGKAVATVGGVAAGSLRTAIYGSKDPWTD